MDNKLYTSRISIVMPFYNAESFLKESVDSILDQTFSDFELILINDGSTDNCLKIINQYNDKRIKLINNSHNFIESLNLGITESKGKYIARMDVDDIMTKNRLAIQYDFMESHPEIDVCGSWMKGFGKYQGIIKTLITHDEIVNGFFYGNPMCHPTIMMKSEIRKLFDIEDNVYKIYHDAYPYAEDYKLWSELLYKGCRLENIPLPLLKYRISDKQVTAIHSREMAESAYRIQREFLESIVRKYQ